MVPLLSLDEALDLHRAVLDARGLSPFTIRQYAACERQFIAYVSSVVECDPTVAHLTVAHARGWLDVVRARASKETERQYGTILRIWARLLVAKKELKRDPLHGLDLPEQDKTRRPAAYTRAEMARMILLCSTTRFPKRNTALTTLMADTGLRVGELEKLRLGDFTPARGEDPARLRIHGKGGRARTVHPGRKVSLALFTYIKSRERPAVRSPESPLFTPDGVRPLSRGAIAFLCRELAERAGITDKRNSPHVWRHSYATAFAKQHRGEIVELQNRLGHSSLTMSRHYIQLAESTDEPLSVLDEWNEIH